MSSREEVQARCERQIRRNGCFHLEMAGREGDSSAAFQQCFLPILRASGRCGVFGPRAYELVEAEGDWSLGEGGGYWKTFADDYSSANACWSPDRISLEVSILVPVRVDNPSSAQSLRSGIRDCRDPNSASNPSAIVTEDSFVFAWASSRKGDLLWLSFRSYPMNLYVTVLGKPAVVIQWFRFAIDNAHSDYWSRR